MNKFVIEKFIEINIVISTGIVYADPDPSPSLSLSLLLLQYNRI